MLAQRRRGHGVLVPADEGLANDLVGRGGDDGDVGYAIVRRVNLHLHVNLLASSVLEDLAAVGEGDTLALPNLAVRVATLEVLDGTLNVAVLVRALGVENLVTAGGFEALTRLTRTGAGDVAVGGDGGGEASNGGGNSERLHCEVVVGFFERVKGAVEMDGSLASVKGRDERM